MRKWMRERLQRRKKTPTAEGGETPPPLQPAYFEAATPPHRPPEEGGPVSEKREAPKKEAAKKREIEVESASADATEPGPGDHAPSPAQGEPISRSVPADRNRGRRRRGGRGRGGRDRQQSVARAFTPAAVKGIVEAPSEETPSAAGRAVPVAESAPPSGQRAVPPVVASRTPKGVVVLAIGLPGSGKSSWFKRNNVVPLSSDMVRALLFDDPAEQRFQDLVFANLRSMLKARLIARRPMNYVDATNLTPQERHNWIKLAKDYGYEVQAVFFDVPLEVCIERHQRRDRVVPEDVIRRMATKLKAPTFDEGFSKITLVRVKKKAEQPDA
jgi:predicted kinase